MREILRTNDPVLLSYARHLLDGQGIGSFVFDQNISAVEGGICAFPRRLMVSGHEEAAARLALAEIREHLSPEEE